MQWSAQGDLQGEFLLGALGGVWQSLEQFQSLGEVTDRLYMGRALAGSLPCPLPIRDRLLNQSSLGVMMRKEFRLRFLDVSRNALPAPAQSVGDIVGVCS